MNTITCPPAQDPHARRTWATRILAALKRRSAAWGQARRDAALARAHWRALQALDNRTRRDLGLAEGAPADDLMLDRQRNHW